MSDAKREPVERFKLGKDLIDIERGFRQRAKLAKALKQGIALKTNELMQLSNVLFKTEDQQKALVRMVPPEQQEVEGTPIPTQDLQINY